MTDNILIFRTSIEKKQEIKKIEKVIHPISADPRMERRL